MRHKLTEEQRKGIREWLRLRRLSKSSMCPFDSPCDCAICYNWFPRTGTGIGFCPCSVYDLGEVIKIAKKMLVYPAYAKESKNEM